MEQRAQAAADTRQRIIAAALRVYRKQGFSASLQSVAREARVSAATVLNHFDDANALIREVIRHILENLGAPDSSMFDSLSTRRDRICRLVQEFYRFYDRSAGWVVTNPHERETIPPIVEGEKQFFDKMQSLSRQALGTRTRSSKKLRLLLAMIAPGVHGSYRANGFSTDQAARIVSDMVNNALETI